MKQKLKTPVYQRYFHVSVLGDCYITVIAPHRSLCIYMCCLITVKVHCGYIVACLLWFIASFNSREEVKKKETCIAQSTCTHVDVKKMFMKMRQTGNEAHFGQAELFRLTNAVIIRQSVAATRLLMFISWYCITTNYIQTQITSHHAAKLEWNLI